MLQFGTDRMVCLGSTHGTNQYQFNLVTLIVIDDREGLPVAFMLSNREDELVLREFFSTVKRCLTSDTFHCQPRHYRWCTAEFSRSAGSVSTCGKKAVHLAHRQSLAQDRSATCGSMRSAAGGIPHVVQLAARSRSRCTSNLRSCIWGLCAECWFLSLTILPTW